MRAALSALVLTLSAFAVTACGSSSDPADGPADTTVEEPAIKLAFALRPMGEKGSTEGAELICPSDDPELADACAAVESLPPSALAPVSPTTACTDIFGGADQLLVQGMIDGQSITASLNRLGGCEIDRFDAWMPVVEELYPGYEPGGSINSPK